MKYILVLSLLFSFGCSRIDIVAHRGFWNTDEVKFSENSLAALKLACEEKFQGCELDIHTTADSIVMVNHDSDINGKKISDHPYSDFGNDLLPNGEIRPTLDSYLATASIYPSTKLLIEFKNGDCDIVDKTISLLKKHGMYSSKRVTFISFNLDLCKEIAQSYPEFTNQYLGGELSPCEIASYGINGISYHFSCFQKHPEWVKQAHELKMSVNVWTVDDSVTMKQMIDLGVDAITTNKPLLLRSLL